jgi:hypothetical protein
LIRREQATVTLSAATGPFRIVDTRRVDGGQQIVNQYGPFEHTGVLIIKAGQHEFRVERDGTPLPSWSVALLPGDAPRHVFEPAPTPPAAIDPRHPEAPPTESQPSSSHVLPYILWGGSVVAGATSVGLLLEAHHFQQQADADFERNCPQGVDTSSARCVRTTAGDAKAANWRTAALVTGVVAGAAAIGGMVAYWLDLSADASATDEAGSGKRDVRAWMSPTSIGIEGTF